MTNERKATLRMIITGSLRRLANPVSEIRVQRLIEHQIARNIWFKDFKFNEKDGEKDWGRFTSLHVFVSLPWNAAEPIYNNPSNGQNPNRYSVLPLVRRLAKPSHRVAIMQPTAILCSETVKFRDELLIKIKKQHITSNTKHIYTLDLFRASLDWLIVAYLLRYVLWDCLGELVEKSLWKFSQAFFGLFS